jgi:oligopeptide/dipeptide ABC transporter ATP-binding protein
MIEEDVPFGRNAPPVHSGPMLDVRDLTVHFKNPHGVVRAVDGVSMSVEKGKTVGIVGESGSGKSVFVRAILGLTPKGAVAHSSGEVFFEGRDLRIMSEKELRQDIRGTAISMIFQDSMTALNPVMKIGRQITESLRVHYQMSRRAAAVAAVDLLEQVGIPSPRRRFNEYPNQLSGGMRQRVVIAIALSCEPRLLIADEPTTALDVTVQAQILDLLAEKQAERHMTMVLVTHDLGVVATRTDEIMVMYAGQVVERAPTWLLFANYRMPYTEALMKSIPRLEFPSHTRLLAVPGRPPSLLDPAPGCPFAPRCAYVQTRCREEKPPLREADVVGHAFACWYPVGTEAATEALEHNRRRGLIQAGADPSTSEVSALMETTLADEPFRPPAGTR